MSELFNTHSLEYKKIFEDFQYGLHEFIIGDIDFLFHRLSECVSQIRSQLKYTEDDSPGIIISLRLEPDHAVVQEKYVVSKLYDCIMEITTGTHSLLLPHPNDEYGEIYSHSLIKGIEKIEQEIYVREKEEGLLKIYSIENLKKRLDALPNEEKLYVVRHLIVELRQNVEVMQYIPLEIIRAEDLLHELKNPQADSSIKSTAYSIEELAGLKNRFNSLPMKDVIDFFSVLLEKENNCRETWMTEPEFNTFIRRSFAEEDLEKPNINLGTTGKMAIVKLFWLFYNRCQRSDLQENRSKVPFLELLEDAFDTDMFIKLRSDNFKSDKSNYVWY